MTDPFEISDEMLAAFIDGNAAEKEVFLINESKSIDESLTETLEIFQSFNNETYDAIDVQHDLGYDRAILSEINSPEFDCMNLISMNGIESDQDFSRMDDNTAQSNISDDCPIHNIDSNELLTDI